MSGHGFKRDHAGGEFDIADPGDGNYIETRGKSGVCNLVSVTAGGETRKLRAPQYIGQWILFVFDTDGGDVVLTAYDTAGAADEINQSGHTNVTFDDAGEYIQLIAGTVAGVLHWRALCTNPESESPAVA